MLTSQKLIQNVLISMVDLCKVSKTTCMTSHLEINKGRRKPSIVLISEILRCNPTSFESYLDNKTLVTGDIHGNSC